MDSDKSIVANFDPWTAPIGIPTPAFGISENYRMYDDPGKRNSELTYLASPGGGYYTHYVDNTDPCATDTDNPYGTVDKPRLTLPLHAGDLPSTQSEWLAPGTVMEVHGGPYEYTGITAGEHGRSIYSNATAEKPAFIRGVGNPHIYMQTTENKGAIFWLCGHHLVVEGFYFDTTCVWMKGKTGLPTVDPYCIAVRGNEFSGNTSFPALSAIKTYGISSYVNNIVIHANEIHHYGDSEYTGTSETDDVMGVVLSPNSQYIWIVDNHIHHNGGDSIHMGISAARTVRDVYVGRNNMHSDRENAVDIKQCQDIIVSQNAMHDYLEKGRADDSVCFVIHEGTMAAGTCPYRIWVLFNEIYDGSLAGQQLLSSDEVYMIGNIVHDIPNATPNDLHSKAFSSYNFTSTERHYYIGNTIYNCETGILSTVASASASNYIANNIFNTLSEGTSNYWQKHIWIENYTDNATVENNLFYQSGGQASLSWGYTVYTLSGMQALGECDGCVEADPEFADLGNGDLHLQNTSLAIDAGKSSGVVDGIFNHFKELYGVDIRRDIEGKNRTAAWDIGAYEYVIEAAGNLAVSGTSQNSATLRWTVPGEVGITGTPAQYDIRYAGSTITEANWGTATQVQGEPIPGNFGDQQSFTITGLDPNATYCFAMKILDVVGHSSSLSNVVSMATARSGNYAPVFTVIGDRSVVEMATLTFPIVATDADANSLTYSASGLPTGATFTAATRTFAWTPTDTQEGVYHVMFQVTDGQVTVWETITITVLSGSNHPPELAAIGNKTVNEGETLSFTVSATDVDPGQTVTYSVSGLPSGAAFVGQDFTWTPGYDQAGVYNVTFTTSDGQAQDSETITVTVANVNRKPEMESIGGKQVNENFSLTFSVNATDPDGDSVNYSASGLPSGASFSSGTFSWTPSFTQAGTYVVTFVASDGSLSDTEQVTITVGNVADETAPAVVDLYPEPDAIQIPVNPLIVFAVSDAGLGVDANTVTIQVDGQLVYSGNQAESQSIYGICRRTGTKASYRYHYQPASGFDFDQHVSMCVTASDLANNVMDPCSYEFVTEMRSFGGNEAISPDDLAGGHSAMATDGQGNVWAVCHAGQEGLRDVYVMKRDGSTLSWGDPVRLTDPTSDQCNPVVAVASNDAVYVAWQDNRRGNWDIYVSSTADGVTWRDAVRVTDSNDNQTHPAIAIDGGDPPRVYIAWEDDGAGNQNIWLASSNTSFAGSTIVQVTSNATDETEPALAAGQGNVVYAVWTDRRNGSADIYGAASNASWTNRPVVTGDGDQYSPAIAVESGTSSLHFVWVDDAAGNSDVLYGSSTGLPAGPLAGVSLVDDTTGASQLAPAIVTASDSLGRQHVYACWQDSRASGDIPDTDLYFVEIRSGTAGTNILVGDDGANSDQSEPALGFDGGGQPVILWTDDRDVTPYIYGTEELCFGPTALASVSIASASGGIVGPAPASIDEITDISIRIPANAYDCDAVYTIWQVRNLPLFASPCLAACEIGPSGVEFLSPATITMPHATSGTGLAVPYWYDAQTGTLSQEGISNVANTTSTNGIPVVSFQTMHLTSFYILEGTVSSGGGGGGCSLAPGKAKKVDKTMPSTSNKKLRSQRGPVPGTPKVASLVYQPEAVEYFIPYAALAGIMIGLRIRDRRRYRE
jgi:hypothetical protein